MKTYEYSHIVGFEETNLVGNVYYANFILWQGRCREMFLRDHAPEIIDDIKNGLCLVTVSVSCEYYKELFALDKLVVKMSIDDITQNRVSMLFDYYRVEAQGGETHVAHGNQQIACMKNENDQLCSDEIPECLISALSLYQDK